MRCINMTWREIMDVWQDIGYSVKEGLRSIQERCPHDQREVVWHLCRPGDTSPQVVCFACGLHLGDPVTVDEMRLAEVMRQNFIHSLEH